MTDTTGTKGRAFWGLTAGAVVLALVAGSLFLRTWLWDSVASRTTAFFIYMGWMALVLAAAAATAAFAMRLVFPSAYGKPRVRKAAEDPESEGFMDLGTSASLFQPVSIYYSIAVVILSVAFAFLAQVLSAGALLSFKMVQWEAMSRADDPAQLHALFVDVTEMKRPAEVDRFIRKLPLYFEHPDEEVRADAIQTMAVMAQRMTLSVALLVRDGDILEDRWEPAIVDWLHQEVSPQLKALYARGVTPRPNLVRALAWTQNPGDGPFFTQLARSENAVDGEFIEAVVGLGNLGGLPNAAILVEAALQRPGVPRVWALWSLQRIGESLEVDDAEEQMGDEVLALLTPLLEKIPELDDSGLCAAVVAVQAFQHAGTTAVFTQLFESQRGELVCPRIELTLPSGPPLVVVPAEELRWMLLNFLADVGAGNFELTSWIAHMLNTRQFDSKITTGLQKMYSQLRQPDDD